MAKKKPPAKKPTKKQQAAALSAFRAERQKEKDDLQAAVDSVYACLNGKARADHVFARVLNKATCGSLNLQWLVEHYWHLRMPAILDKLNKIYDELVRKGITKDKEINFNDADDNLWYEPCNQYRVIAHTGQTLRMLYIWEYRPEIPEEGFSSFRNLHVRRFYDRFADRHDPKDKFDIADEKEFVKKIVKGGRAAAVKEANFITEYADDDRTYPERHSLEAFRKMGFEPKYRDFRDTGYVLSWEEFTGKVDNPMSNFHLIELIESCFVPCMEQEVFELDD